MSTVWLYEAGSWVEIDDPITWGKNGEIVVERYAAAGYAQGDGAPEPFIGLEQAEGTGQAGYVPGLALWVRSEPPQCLIDISGTDGTSRAIYAARLPDGLDLMARWVPIVSAGSTLDIIAGITGQTSRAGSTGAAVAMVAAGEIVESIVARVHRLW